MMPIYLAVVSALVAAAVGFFIAKQQVKKEAEEYRRQKEKAQAEADKLLKEARNESRQLIKESTQKAEKAQSEVNRLTERLQKQENKLEERRAELDERLEKLRLQKEDIEKAKKVIYDIRQQQEDKLAKISKLSKAEVEEKLRLAVESNIKADLLALIAKKREEAQKHAEEDSRAILLSAMERLASDTASERTITTVKIDNEEIKGRIIGKEGRNIQALQQITGVDILVDDSPGVIVISCFDPIRREVARQTLEMLIKDGRIHPARIESLTEKAQQQVQKEVNLAAEGAAREVGVLGIPPAILQLLGELRFRTSYGQNVLKHSTEMAHLAGVLAEQIGADVNICKYAALVHDLGKALTHKMEGKHHHLSGEMLRKYGVDEAVAHAAEAHHDDIEATTPEAMVIRVVDAVSAARPGARNISAENFVERMKTLENIANGFRGIDKSYAISAGREMRVFVKPNDLDDLQSIQVARDIALKIESMMNYPGTIKVTVIRETRAIEYAK